jgi:DNA-binding winged helix-turn-helix (wHTH) protein
MDQSETRAAGYRFGDVHIDVRNRQVWRGGRVFPLSSKYFDALLLLVRERGRLVEKQRLFDEVWEGVPVTDAALTQCIKDIRRQLGDDAANPRYIKTVPKHGYIFIFDGVEAVPEDEVTASKALTEEEGALRRLWGRLWRSGGRGVARQGAGGAAGGAASGVVGGFALGGGLAMARHASAAEAVSLLFVMVGLGAFIGAAGGLGVGGGMAAGHLTLRGRRWGAVVGGAVGGAMVGGVAQFLGVDALRALFGHRLVGITGAFEGAAVGLGTSLGAALAGGEGTPPWRRMAGASGGAMCAAVSLSLIGGTLFSGSLEILARSFSDSQIGMDPLAALFGEAHFGRTTQAVLGALEGALFGGGLMGGIYVAENRK